MPAGISNEFLIAYDGWERATQNRASTNEPLERMNPTTDHQPLTTNY